MMTRGYAQNLNNAIKWTYHKTPTMKKISHHFNGSAVFSKLDAKYGYWDIVLVQESSKLCTFQGPACKHRFLRLPFGLSVSKDIFQKGMDDIICGAAPGVLGIADGICVFGIDATEHDEALHHLMQVATKYGHVFRPQKCYIRQDKISFCGFRWSKEGMKPDEYVMTIRTDLPDKCL